MEEPTREDDVGDVTRPLVRRGRRQHPAGQSAHDAGRLLEVEQGEADAVDLARDRGLDAVVDQEPAVLGAERWRPEADPRRIPPGALAGSEHLLAGAEVDKIVGTGDSDLAVSAFVLRLGPVKEHPAALDPVREERGVLVVRLSDDAAPLDAREVLCRREENGWARGSVGGAGDDPAVELVDPDDARILESPLLARGPARGEQRLGIDRPVADAVRRTGDSQVRDPPTVFDPGEQDGLAVDDRGGRVEDGVDGIGPVLRAENRIGRMALEELRRAHATAGLSVRAGVDARMPAASSARARAVSGATGSLSSMMRNRGPAWR